jgi:hypothetical protein
LSYSASLKPLVILLGDEELHKEEIHQIENEAK